MPDSMAQFKNTANEHMRRDMEAKGKWVCQCEACREIRSLVGMDKVLGVRPLVRDLENMEAQLATLPEGQEKKNLLARYHQIFDQLAELVAK